MNESKNNNIVPPESNFLLYTTPEGDVKIEVFFQNETVWLTQKRMAELFNVSVATVNEHLTNIYKSRELSEVSTIRNFRIVQKEGSRRVEREVNFYNLMNIRFCRTKGRFHTTKRNKKLSPSMTNLIKPKK